MPSLWSVRDGPRINATRGEGTPTKFAEIRGAFGNSPRFVSAEPPAFNIDAASTWPTRIVVEVKADEAKTPEFPRPGFYEIVGLAPTFADNLLRTYRQKNR